MDQFCKTRFVACAKSDLVLDDYKLALMANLDFRGMFIVNSLEARCTLKKGPDIAKKYEEFRNNNNLLKGSGQLPFLCVE